jgi:hypothetical protein
MTTDTTIKITIRKTAKKQKPCLAIVPRRHCYHHLCMARRLWFHHYRLSSRKTEEEDQLHKWIGYYNTKIKIITKFFKWLYYPDIKPEERKSPPIIQNIHFLKRKEVSNYNNALDSIWYGMRKYGIRKLSPKKQQRRMKVVIQT